MFAYTGDSGPDPQITGLARGADLLLAEATYASRVPPDAQAFLSSAAQAGRTATQAGVAHLTLTHLWPGTSHQAARTAAAAVYHGQISVATPGLSLDLG